MRVERDGRSWLVGTQQDVAWLGGRPDGVTVETALPLVFEAYATVLPPHDRVPEPEHERALVDVLVAHTAEQPWWLGFLDTGAHDVVFADAPRVRLYWDWEYVLVQAGPQQALSWRTGHMRSGEGHLPDLVFPADRSWALTALWDDTWGCLGGSAVLVDELLLVPSTGGRRVSVEQDVCPPGVVRD